MKVSRQQPTLIKATDGLRRRTVLSLLVCIGLGLSVPENICAQLPAFEWIRLAGGTNQVLDNGIKVDRTGNIYVIGNFTGGAILGTTGLVTSAEKDIFVAKFSNIGQLQWVRTSAGGGYNICWGMTLDTNANVYITGSFFRDTIVLEGVTLANSSSGNEEIFLAKYDSAGNLQWGRRAGGQGNDGGRSIAVGSDGFVYVTGFAANGADFGGIAITNSGRSDVFLAKYDTNANIISVKQGNASFEAFGTQVTIDSYTNCYLAGSFFGRTTFGALSITNLSTIDGAFLVKYNPNGVVLWARKAVGGGVYPASIATDEAGNVFVGGGFTDFAAFDSINGAYLLTSAGGSDAFLVKYDPGGNVLWATRAGGGQDDSMNGIDVDEVGSCFVVGEFSGIANFGHTNLASAGSLDIFIAKYDKRGNLQWIEQAGGATGDTGGGVALAGASNLCVLCTISGTAAFGNTNVTVNGAYQDVVAKLQVPPAAPMILVQPQSQTVTAGNDLAFNVAASGTSPLNYQWQFNGFIIAAARSSRLTISNVKPANAGDYTVVVANDYGSVTSAVATLTVNFTLTVSVNGTGTVTRSPDLANYPPNSVVTLTAVPTAGYAFDSWSGDASGRRNPLAVTMSSNLTITANFVSTALAITVQGPGSVTKSPDEPFYNVGDQVTLTATTSASWYAFNHWGDGGTNNPRLIFIGANNNYTAIFSPTTAVETLTFGSVSRTAPVGMPAIFVDGNFEVTNTVTRLGSARIVLQTSFPNGTIFYTLDGSPPTFIANLYAGPFELRRSATIRAAAWDAIFSTFWEADPVTVVIQPAYSLTTSTPGGGSIGFSPTNALYLSNTVVMASAIPAAGWGLLQWLGDARGNDPTIQIVMTRDKCVEAVFGTTLNTAVAGNGLVALNPNTALYPYGTAVTLTAVPQGGSFFVVWGDAVSSTNNPLRFVVTNADSTISAAFSPLFFGRFALTVMTSGSGRVTVNPHANIYRQGQRVTLEAAPDAGQEFLGWTGDASGTLTNLFVVMDQSRVFTANFTRRPRLSLGPCLGGLSEDGFQLTLTGEYGARYEIDGSTTLIGWTALATVTNLFGTAQFRDQTGTNSPYRFYRAILLP